MGASMTSLMLEPRINDVTATGPTACETHDSIKRSSQDIKHRLWVESGAVIELPISSPYEAVAGWQLCSEVTMCKGRVCWCLS